MTDEDPEVRALMAKRMAQMRRQAAAAEAAEAAKGEGGKPGPSARQVVASRLGHRGEEVLANAESQWPRETAVIVERIAEIINTGELPGTISGGELLGVFASLGIRVRMNTKISVEHDGKMVSLSDKLGKAGGG